MRVRYFWSMHVLFDCMPSLLMSLHVVSVCMLMCTQSLLAWRHVRDGPRLYRCPRLCRSSYWKYSEFTGTAESPHRIPGNVAVVGITHRVPSDTGCYPCGEVRHTEHVKIIPVPLLPSDGRFWPKILHSGLFSSNIKNPSLSAWSESTMGYHTNSVHVSTHWACQNYSSLPSFWPEFVSLSIFVKYFRPYVIGTALLVMRIRNFWFMHVFCLRSLGVSTEEYGSPILCRWSSTRARIRFSRCWSEAAGRHQSPHRISRNLAMVGITRRVPYSVICELRSSAYWACLNYPCISSLPSDCSFGPKIWIVLHFCQIFSTLPRWHAGVMNSYACLCYVSILLLRMFRLRSKGCSGADVNDVQDGHCTNISWC